MLHAHVVCSCLKLVFFFIPLLYFSRSIFDLIDGWFWIVLSVKCFIFMSACIILKIHEAEHFVFFQSLIGLYFWCILCVLCLTFPEVYSCAQKKMSELRFTWQCEYKCLPIMHHEQVQSRFSSPLPFSNKLPLVSGFPLTLPVPCILASYVKIKSSLNFYFHTSLWPLWPS